MQQSKCTVCQSINNRIWFSVDGKYYNGPGKLPGEIYKCSNCGSIYKMYNNIVENIYNNDYVNCAESEFQGNEENYSEIIEYIKYYNKPEILDVGIGKGVLLETLFSDGYCIEGVEINTQLAKRATDKGITVYNINIENVIPDKSYDIILVLDLIEHFEDPLSFLNNIKKCLRKNGVIIIHTPNHDCMLARLAISFKDIFNINSISDQIFACSHITFFTPKSIEFLFEKSGYRVEKMIQKPYDIHNPGMRIKKIKLLIIYLVEKISMTFGFGGFRMTYIIKAN